LQALRLGEAQRAEDDLTVLLQGAPESAEEVFARRALARLALGRPLDAESDAANAYRRNPSRSRERLWVRTLLAAGRVEKLLWLDRPDDLTVLPGAGPSLRADLRAASEQLRLSTGETRAPSTLACRTRAVLLSALNDPAAVAEADRAVALAPQSADAYLVRARVRRRSGNPRGAMADVEAGLGLGPGDPRLLELRGLLKTESGNPEAGMIDLNRAVTRGARGTVRFPKARTLMALGRYEEAVEEWTRALAEDPDDPQAYLGRALALLRLRQHVRAMVDLDQAAEWAADNADLQTRITLAYAACLPGHPERFSRWLALARHAWSAWTSTAVSGTLRRGPEEAKARNAVHRD
jgi:tetratricopeptide (TPR) repeat protein